MTKRTETAAALIASLNAAKKAINEFSHRTYGPPTRSDLVELNEDEWKAATRELTEITLAGLSMLADAGLSLDIDEMSEAIEALREY